MDLEDFRNNINIELDTILKKIIVGDIFISYTTIDKIFARKLAGEIESRGYSVWLDEKKLVGGDYLPKTIGQAIRSSKVMLLVISKDSVSSKWVRHEINHGVQRMIDGTLRLVPLLIDTIDLLPELEGLVYIDFRESFEQGLAKTISVFEQEMTKYNLTKSSRFEFQNVITAILKKEFTSLGTMDVSGEYKSKDFNVAALNDIDVGYEIVNCYSADQMLTQSWWHEFTDYISDSGLQYFIVITERPIDEFLPKLLEPTSRRIWLTEINSSIIGLESIIIVVVDLSKITSAEEYCFIIKEAKKIILSKIQTQDI